MAQPEGRPNRSWQEIAEDAAHEGDPDRLLKLTEELEQALDDRDKLPAQTEKPKSKKESAA